MVHSLLAVEIGLDDLGGALGGQRGTGDGGFFGGSSWGERFRDWDGPRSQSPYSLQGSQGFAKHSRVPGPRIFTWVATA